MTNERSFSAAPLALSHVLTSMRRALLLLYLACFTALVTTPGCSEHPAYAPAEVRVLDVEPPEAVCTYYFETIQSGISYTTEKNCGIAERGDTLIVEVHRDYRLLPETPEPVVETEVKWYPYVPPEPLVYSVSFLLFAGLSGYGLKRYLTQAGEAKMEEQRRIDRMIDDENL